MNESRLLKITQLDFDPTNDECAWIRGEGVLKRLEDVGLISVTKVTGGVTECVTVVTFMKRQVTHLTNAERQARFRAKKKA